MKRTGKIDSIHVDKFMYDRQRDIDDGKYFVDLSKSTPDADDKITVKRFVFDDSQEKLIKKIQDGEADEIVFVNTHQETKSR